MDDLLKKYETIQNKIKQIEGEIRDLKDQETSEEILSYAVDNDIDKIQLKGGHLTINKTKIYKAINKKNIKETLLDYNIQDIDNIIKEIYTRDYKEKTVLKFIKNKNDRI